MAAYVKIDGIPGQETDSNHKDWITAKSARHVIRRPMISESSGRGQSTATFDDMVINTVMGKHVPKLAEAVANGTTFKEVEIHICTDQGGGKREPYYKVKLTDAAVSHLFVENSSGGGQADAVEVCLNFSKIEWTFTQWDGNTKKGDTKATWNVKDNQP